MKQVFSFQTFLSIKLCLHATRSVYAIISHFGREQASQRNSEPTHTSTRYLLALLEHKSMYFFNRLYLPIAFPICSSRTKAATLVV